MKRARALGAKINRKAKKVERRVKKLAVRAGANSGKLNRAVTNVKGRVRAQVMKQGRIAKNKIRKRAQAALAA